MDVREGLDWLFSTQMFGIKLGLERTRELLRDFGAMPAPDVTVIHIAGTNGKGSTAAMIEALARKSGRRTGLFTSPHLVDFSERIRVNGEPIPSEDLARLLERAKSISESKTPSPTFFELTLAIALEYFSEQHVQSIILETGLGGRLDATNAIPKNIAVLTPIGLDHQQYLGSTLDLIAAEKAAIIENGKPVVSAQQEPLAAEVISQTALARNASLTFVSPIDQLSLATLPGRHQQANAALAIAAINACGYRLDDKQTSEALSSVHWPGRFEITDCGKLVLDGAHNPHAARVLVDTWLEQYGNIKTSIVFGAAADKNVEEIIAIIDPIAAEWRLAPSSSPRLLPPEQLEKILKPLTAATITVHSTLESALETIPGLKAPLLATGSFFLIGDIKTSIIGKAARPTLQ